MFITPAFKENTQVGKGRGKGGLATIWNKSLTKYVSKINCQNFRIQATKFAFPSGSFLLLNSYFPCDPRTTNFDETELVNLLAEIRRLMLQEKCVYNLVLGDLNTHFLRQTRFTSLVKNFFEDINFKIFWELSDPINGPIQEVDFTFSLICNNKMSSSVIDHFVSNDVLLNAVTEAGVIHAGDNPSNHSPIFAKFKINGIDPSVEQVQGQKRVNWAKATENEKLDYHADLQDRLNCIAVPDSAHCGDILCGIHTEELEDYTMQVLEAVEAAGKTCLSSTGGGMSSGKLSIIAGWNEYVKPFCEESKFWHSVWQSAGKPQQGDILVAMKNSKLQYKYAVRRLKRANLKIQNDKFVQSLITDGGMNIFKEIKKFRGDSRSCSSTIDGEVGAKNIANRFADIYNKLYNKHEHGPAFDELQNKISRNVTPDCFAQVDRITEDLVEHALKSMKAGKNDALFDFQSDCLIQGPKILITHLTNMIKSFVMHGQVPYFILVCSLLPLVKDNLADITSSDNYRAIASGSLILKLLDIVVLMLEGDKLGCDQLQFGFQAKASTSMCTWTATTVIEHYNKNGSVVYGCAMDLSKAFDLVEWVDLFNTLMDRNIEPVFLRILLFIYKNQSCDVKWNGKFSYRFSVSNGVRQGAVSSPLLFSVYIDGLIVRLRNSGLGCYIDHHFYGCLGYADDLLLLSASRTGLQSMVTICEKFAKAKSLQFSTNLDPVKSKTKCLIFSPRAKDRSGVAPVVLNGDPLPWVEEVKHLGNILQSENNMKHDAVVKRGKFIGKINSLLQELYFVEPDVFMKLMNIYCSSFYGSNLWDLYSKEVDRIFKSWNITVRNVFKIPFTTHRYLIEPLSACMHPKTMLTSRYVKFLGSLISSTKNSVRFLVNLVKDDNRTLTGRTVSRICDDTNLRRTSLSAALVRKNMVYFPVPAGQEWRSNIILELLNARKSTLWIGNLESDELTTIINHLCTT